MTGLTDQPVQTEPEQAGLRRVLSLPLITLYGIGGIIGAGIYVLIGKIAGTAGLYAPVAFIVAASIALFSALSYAELSSRVPSSGGEVTYIQHGFQLRYLSLIVGLAICMGGIVSSAAITRGAAGYLQVYLSFDTAILVLLFVAITGAIACWGVLESVTIAALITSLELGGLLIAIVIGGPNIPALFDEPAKLIPQALHSDWVPILSAALLAFYAYIGFEDMVNMGDEVKDPKRTMPIAILIALVVSTLLYILVSLVFISSVPLNVLSNSDAPFVELIQGNSSLPVSFITLISLLAITNGALVQMIMSARILYGMSKQQLLSGFLGKVNPVTRTPVNASVLVIGAVLVFALALPVESLARITSYVLLAVFSLVNLSLVLIKRRESKLPIDQREAVLFSVPILIPIIGFLLCAGFLVLDLIN